MFFEKTAAAPTPLEDAIARLMTELQLHKPETDEYEKIVDNIVKLHNLKEAEKPEGLSTDAKASIIANLAGIMLILNYERAGIIASKSLALLAKIR